jgi:hypothetical protein
MILALKLLPDGTIEEIFNGPASVAHKLTVGRKADSAGFVALSHNKLRALMKSVPRDERIPLRSRSAKVVIQTLVRKSVTQSVTRRPSNGLT